METWVKFRAQRNESQLTLNLSIPAGSQHDPPGFLAKTINFED